MKSRIGVVQMNSSNRAVDNVAFAKVQIAEAADQGLDLVSFPETFVYVGENHSEKHQVAQTLDGELVQTFRDLASQHDISVLLGSIYEKTPDEE